MMRTAIMRTINFRYVALLLFISISGPTAADVFRPAYLELSQLDEERYAVLWRVPALADSRRLAASPEFPSDVAREGPSTNRRGANNWEERFVIVAPGGLLERAIRIEGILGGTTDVIVRVERSDGTTQLERLSPTNPQFIVRASPGPGEIAWDYLVLGVEHILGGIDHLLLVLALLLLVRDLRRLVLTITAFTLAHSITLVSASLGWISLPGPPVEAIIALSIVFVAAEVLNTQRGKASLTANAPWVVAFAFGLLHGLGFAGALEEVGLPETAVPVALLMFNVGVEIGQLVFVSAMVILASLLGRFTSVSFERVSVIMSYCIGSVAAFWTIERVVAFF